MTLRLTPVLLLAAACAAPITQTAGVSREDIQREQLEQQKLVIQSEWKAQQRLESIALPMLKAARPVCGDRVAVRSGLLLASAGSYERDWRPAARALGLSDTVSIIGVVRGSGAERVGLRAGDRVVSLAGEPLPGGPKGVREVGKRIEKRFALKATPSPGAGSSGRLAPYDLSLAATALPVSVLRDSAELRVEIPMDTVCAFAAVAQKSDDLNAFADGEKIYVTSAMMRFAAEEGELETVVAHEIAHNAMRHIDAKKRNALLGGLLGAALDIGLATQGVYTGGEYANQLAKLGAMVFSQDFEREADYVGLYLMARADHDVSHAANLWRRMATESPGSIKFATTHPTTAERYVRLERTIQEIEAKRASGAPLLPELKAGEGTGGT